MPNIDTTDPRQVDARLTRIENALLLALEREAVDAEGQPEPWWAIYALARLLSRLMRTRVVEQGESARVLCQRLVGHLAGDVQPPTPTPRPN
jgi:hypothetical protein